MEKLKTRATSSHTTLNAFSFVGFSNEKLFSSPEWVSIWVLECSCPSSLRPCAVYVLSEYLEYCVWCSEMRIYYLLLWRVREYNFTISLCSPPPRSVVLFYLHFPKTHNTFACVNYYTLFEVIIVVIYFYLFQKTDSIRQKFNTRNEWSGDEMRRATEIDGEKEREAQHIAISCIACCIPCTHIYCNNNIAQNGVYTQAQFIISRKMFALVCNFEMIIVSFSV